MAAALLVLVAVGCGQRPQVSFAQAPANGAQTQMPLAPADAAASQTDAPLPPDPTPARTLEAVSPVPSDREPVQGAPATPLTEGSGRAAHPPTTAAEGSGDLLWGESFASVRVVEAGRERPMADEAPLRLNFDRTPDPGVLRWSAGCNTGGADVTIRPRRLVLGEDGGMTHMGCDDALAAQEAWYLAFLYSNPSWELSDDGDELVLRSRDAVITYERRAWPPWPD